MCQRAGMFPPLQELSQLEETTSKEYSKYHSLRQAQGTVHSAFNLNLKHLSETVRCGDEFS